jgi:Domain of unknown function (DUF5666)
MRTKTILSIVSATAALGTGGLAATSAIASSSPSSSASSGQSAGTLARHIEGPITAIDSAAGTFTVANREHGTSTTVKVTPNTRFDGIRGFSALRTGERVEVKAASVAGTVTANKVERGDRENEHAVGNDRRNHDRFDARGHNQREDRGDDHGRDRGHDRNDD